MFLGPEREGGLSVEEDEDARSPRSTGLTRLACCTQRRTARRVVVAIACFLAPTFSATAQAFATPPGGAAPGYAAESELVWPPLQPSTPAGDPPPPPGVTFAPTNAQSLLAPARSQALADQAQVRKLSSELATETAAARRTTKTILATNASVAADRSTLSTLRRGEPNQSAQLGQLAAAAFVAAAAPSRSSRLAGVLAPGALAEAQASDIGLAHALDRSAGKLQLTIRRVRHLQNTVSSVNRSIGALSSRLTSDRARSLVLEDRLSTAKSHAEDASALLGLVQMTSPDPATGIPEIVLDAYRYAAAYLGQISPSCGISWPDIAAIGEMESGQATYGGTRLAANGDTYPPILGPPLDGSAGNALLVNPGVMFDGGGPFERAIGPMQMLPSSWESIAGALPAGLPDDPSNIFSAATGAALYLCNAAGQQGMNTIAGLESAYSSYNHSASYAAQGVMYAISYGADPTG